MLFFILRTIKAFWYSCATTPKGVCETMHDILQRLFSQFDDMAWMDKLLSLPKADFHSLMLHIFQLRSQKAKPVEMVKALQSNRFSAPSELDPVAYHALEAELLSIAQGFEIKPILLSPAAPFASSSVFGCVDQNNVVSAVRGTEILADPTNMLAVIIAEKLKTKTADNTVPLHYCTTARVLRAQVFPHTGRYFAHFGIFCIVSSGKDSGSYQCEHALLMRQLAYYQELFVEKYKANLSIVLRKRRGYTDGDGFFDRMAELVSQSLPDVPLSFDVESEGNNYYKGMSFKLNMEKDGIIMEIGDGGFVDWMQMMTNNKKERCLISGIGLDRLLL